MAFLLATYNLKNLLAPRNARERTVVEDKIQGIAGLVRDSGADVVGVQEIGSVELARALAARLAPSGFSMAPIVGTPDARGIRCALLSRLEVQTSRVYTAVALPFPVFASDDPQPFGARIPLRRGVVHATIAVPGLESVDVMVTHFKSPLPIPLLDETGAAREPTTAHGRAESLVRSMAWRAAEALYVRARVDDVLAADPKAKVAVVGDFNDVPESAIVRALRSEGPGALFDCAACVDPAVRFSSLHGGNRLQIDHILATETLYRRVNGARFLNAALRDHGVTEPGREEVMSVDSDHAPLVVRFM